MAPRSKTSTKTATPAAPAAQPVVEPVQEPLFCWCVGYWIKLQEWQNSMDPTLLCSLFAATFT